ncbi:MAG: pilus assembly protein PilM [Phycisphaerales bacterium]|nr:MAG: pilus assembly protein PilM [Phycisphaerales bacterium]
MGDRRFLDFSGRHLVGLDIDSAGVRMIQLRRRNGQYVVTGAAASDVAPWDDDPDLHRKNTQQAVRQCLSTLGARGKLAVCGLRGTEVVVRGFEFPALPEEEIKGAVELEAEQLCPFGADERALDYQVTLNDEKRTRGYWVAATTSLIASRRQMVYEAGLKCALMDVDGLALLNCLEGQPNRASEATTISNDDSQDEARPVVLDVGEHYASIALVDRAHRPIVRDVPSGDQEIRHRMSLTAEAWIDLFSGKVDTDEVIRRALEKACAPLVEDIASTLRYYVAENCGTHISQVLLCGRLALSEDFVEILRAKLSVGVTPWNPVAEMPCEMDEQQEARLRANGPLMAVAAGLAMRTI